MTLDGLKLPDAMFHHAYHTVLMYAAKLGVFHASEIADAFYERGRIPSHRGAVEATSFFLRTGREAGWITEIDRSGGFYRIEGVEHPPIIPRALV